MYSYEMAVNKQLNVKDSKEPTQVKISCYQQPACLWHRNTEQRHVEDKVLTNVTKKRNNSYLYWIQSSNFFG